MHFYMPKPISICRDTKNQKYFISQKLSKESSLKDGTITKIEELELANLELQFGTHFQFFTVFCS